MSIDFRADQVQVNKLIVSGGNVNSTNCLLIYGSGSQGSPENVGVINPSVFPSGAVGTDTFFYVSGAVGARGTTQPGIAVFGGDMHISGNLTVAGTTPNTFFTAIDASHITTTSSVALGYLSASLGAQITGSFAHGSLDNVVTGQYSHAEGSQTYASGDYSHAQGYAVTASGDFSHGEGISSEATADGAHAEGYYTVASGQYAHAEGSHTLASGVSSHAEGNTTLASGLWSHVEGFFATSSGQYSHAEGYGTEAYGRYSHAQGSNTIAFGTASFAAGFGTIASGTVNPATYPLFPQAVFGRFNMQYNTDSFFVVGDGDDPINRHDILRVNSGSVQVTGSLFVNGANITSSQMQRVSLAGYNTTNLTSATVIGYGYFDPSDYTDLKTIEFSAVGMNMAGVSGGLDLYDQTNSALIAQLTWSGNSTITTGSYQTTTFSIPISPASYEVRLSQSGGANGGSGYSKVAFVNFTFRW